MFPRTYLIMISAIFCIFAAPYCKADTPGLAPPVGTTTSSATYMNAVDELADTRPEARSAAIERIKSFVTAQSLSLASNHGTEVEGNLFPLIAYQDQAMLFIEEIFLQPPEQQKTLLKLARLPGMLNVLIGIFSPLAAERAESTHELAKFNSLELDMLLSELIGDNSRCVSLAAMEVTWDRKPSPLVVRELWHKAVEAPLLKSIAPRGQPYTFRGQPLMDFTLQPLPEAYDADIATKTLIHLNAIDVSEPLKYFLTECARQLDRKDLASQQTNRLSLVTNSPSMKNALQLAQFFKVKEAASALYTLATQKQTQSYPIKRGETTYFRSNRTTAAAVFLIATDQSTEPFIQLDTSEAGEGIWVAPNEAKEVEAVQKIESWWKVHGK